MKRICIFILAALCLNSCQWFSTDGQDRQVVLVYFAGNNNLSSEGEADLKDISDSWLPSEKDKDRILLVYYHFSDKAPVLSRFYRNRQGVCVEDVINTYPASTNSAQGSTMRMVMADADNAWPGQRHGMILWSHATGFLPEGYFTNPQETRHGGTSLQAAPDPYAWMVKSDQAKSFASENNREIELGELSSALSRHHFDFLIFDCCLMANVEVAYELRNNCDYLLFSPTEILSDGFPYDKIMQPLFTLPTENAMLDIAKSYMDHYKAMSGSYCSATISVVRTSELENLAAVCKPVFQNNQARILTLDRSGVQPYFRQDKHWFYDLGDFFSQVAGEEENSRFVRALDAAVIYKDATEYFLSIKIDKYSGLSIYIPRSEYTVLNNYYKTLQWNKACGLVQ